MRFSGQMIELSTKVNAKAESIVTKLFLTECEVDETVIAASLLSGQSPRVRLQNNFRENGIPKELTISWSEYISPEKVVKIKVPESVDSIAERAKNDPALLKALLDKLGFTTETEE